MTIRNLYRTISARRTTGQITRWGLAAVLALMLAGSVPMSANHVNATTGMTLAEAPLAIHGYDPVAYFDEGRARVGKAAFTVKHADAAYRFVSDPVAYFDEGRARVGKAAFTVKHADAAYRFVRSEQREV